jgi:nucleoid-associated protein YgaU
MVPRKPKLIAAAAVLAAGLGLAWPWRRGDSVPASVLPIATPSTSFGSVPAPQTEPASAPLPTTVSATMIGMGGPPPQAELASAGVTPQLVTVAKPVPRELGEPATFGVDANAPPPSAPQQRSHVVHAGDSLERLAQRYLSDEGRAIEIFDLNREVLENPHLLPIGAELKIPLSAGATEAAISP